MISFFCKKIFFMKSRVRNEQKRCRVAGGKESFVLYFLFLEPALSEPVVSVCRTTEGYQDKRKTHSF